MLLNNRTHVYILLICWCRGQPRWGEGEAQVLGAGGGVHRQALQLIKTIANLANAGRQSQLILDHSWSMASTMLPSGNQIEFRWPMCCTRSSTPAAELPGNYIASSRHKHKVYTLHIVRSQRRWFRVASYDGRKEHGTRENEDVTSHFWRCCIHIRIIDHRL
jgi:hypothetical protein